MILGSIYENFELGIGRCGALSRSRSGANVRGVISDRLDLGFGDGERRGSLMQDERALGYYHASRRVVLSRR